MMKDKILNRTLHVPSAGIHVREREDGKSSRAITGYAILFNTLSEPLWADEDSVAREVIDPAAVTQELLDNSDIKFTMFHDRQLILARSNHGEGTLSYTLDEKGVAFEFEAPNTVDGEKALELVRRGDITGCSFAFSVPYWDDTCVERTQEFREGVCYITYRVKAMTAIYDMTLAADPAYADTEVSTREFTKELREALTLKAEPEEPAKDEKKIKEQIAQMRVAARMKY